MRTPAFKYNLAVALEKREREALDRASALAAADAHLRDLEAVRATALARFLNEADDMRRSAPGEMVPRQGSIARLAGLRGQIVEVDRRIAIAHDERAGRRRDFSRASARVQAQKRHRDTARETHGHMVEALRQRDLEAQWTLASGWRRATKGWPC